ncbi:MAG TPA: ABC transporter ATP-binding protein [Chloroflexota bacterium]|nr:ABC transporter ATP-binding protein [Chloroflexota bacterium]
MVGIDKHFPEVAANQGVNFSARWGEVHALLGENGAGKSTLMSILAGLYKPDAGQIAIDGQLVELHSPGDAIQHGIGMVYQHYKLVPSQTVAENLLLGLKDSPFRLDKRRVASDIRTLSERYHLRVDPERPIWQLSVGEQQRVEILKALQRGARILILDEPTAVLTPQESDELMSTIRQIASEGRTVIFISHKLEEVRGVADRVTVLRGGKVVGAGLDMAGMSTRDLARLMIGSEVATEVRPSRHSSHDVALRLDGVSAIDDRDLPALRSINLELTAGEILGVAGVAGNGQRELAQVVAGLRRPTAGRLELAGKDVTGAGARHMALAGVAHIPEDRLGEGLVGNLPLQDNALLKSYYKAPIASGPFLRLAAALEFTRGLIQRFGIAGATPRSTTRLLSGGQLQRFVLAREMASNPRAVVAVHPTRGLDVAAAAAVHNWLLSSRDDGCAILLISEDLDEVLQLSDRVAVMYEGQIVAVLKSGEADRERIGLMMVGSSSSKVPSPAAVGEG